jgi:hypothetical protein
VLICGKNFRTVRAFWSSIHSCGASSWSTKAAPSVYEASSSQGQGSLGASGSGILNQTMCHNSRNSRAGCCNVRGRFFARGNMGHHPPASSLSQNGSIFVSIPRAKMFWRCCLPLPNSFRLAALRPNLSVSLRSLLLVAGHLYVKPLHERTAAIRLRWKTLGALWAGICACARVRHASSRGRVCRTVQWVVRRSGAGWPISHHWPSHWICQLEDTSSLH